MCSDLNFTASSTMGVPEVVNNFTRSSGIDVFITPQIGTHLAQFYG